MNRFKMMVLALILFGAGLISACDPASLAIGAGASVGAMALEERGFEQAGRDRLAHARLIKQLAQKDIGLVQTLSLELMEGRVMAVGRVQDLETRERIIRLIWNDKEVIEAIDHIEIGTPPDYIQTAHDLTIAAKIKARLLSDFDVQAVNYGIEVHEGNVYILGIAQSPQEIDRLLGHIRQIERVRSITPHIQLKTDKARFDNLYALEQRRKRQGE